ncbi:MAG: RagB/SusD family nutrient uptake outer membrane protein [Dysgonomonas sp.]|nr:RagB/SusD family nutrient uptake outer membrane protein [Dysgonomonas sp.]
MKVFINKTIAKYILIPLCGLWSLHSCNYLDIVPDNIPTIDMAFVDRHSAEKFLFTCYSYLSYDFIDNNVENDPAYLGGDEVFAFADSYINRTNLSLIVGGQNTNNPIANYWESGLYIGIRDCNIFLENIHTPTDITDMDRKRWIAEVKFLKAYYHFLLFRAYGAISIVDENIPVADDPAKMLIYREPVDDCVNYISNLLTEAAADLPMYIEKEATELGRITKPVVLAVKAKLLVTAASPLFNGNPDYSRIVDNKGRTLFNQTVDKAKWEIAAKACKEAIDTALIAGHALYKQAPQLYQLPAELEQEYNLRSILFDKWNKELIWASTKTNNWMLQVKCLPRLESEWRQNNYIQGIINPTIDLVERYYSKNGVPIEEDLDYDYTNRYETRIASQEYKWRIKEGEETARLHFDREPRFYAFIGFDRGIWWGNGRINTNNELYHIRVRANETAGMTSQELRCSTGYFSKKLVDYQTVADKSTGVTTKDATLPRFRLADLYLLYAEALNESKSTPDSEIYYYIDELRTRAGLKPCVEAWGAHSSQPDKPRSQAGMREIIKQERQIELAMEGSTFWDMRRWKDAVKNWNGPIRGWNVQGEDAEDFYNMITLEKRTFSTRDYLWPFKGDRLLENKNLVQNYGW